MRNRKTTIFKRQNPTISGNLFYRKSTRETIAVVEANNDTYCLQKRIEKFPLICHEQGDPMVKNACGVNSEQGSGPTGGRRTPFQTSKFSLFFNLCLVFGHPHLLSQMHSVCDYMITPFYTLIIRSH